MIAGLALGSDVHRYFRFAMTRIALVAVALMPLLYGALYLYTFWDPFGNVDKIPVAVVNLDEAVTVAGQELDAGEQVEQNLISSGQLDLTSVASQDDAIDALQRGEYYFAIIIPADFSAAVASPASADPRQAELEFVFDDGNSYLSTIIGQDAAQQVIAQVNTTISDQIFNQLLVAVQEAEGDLQELVDGGAPRLVAGIETAAEIADGLAVDAQEVSDALLAAADEIDVLVADADDVATRIDDATSGLGAALESGALEGAAAEALDRALQGIDDLIEQVVAAEIDEVNAEVAAEIGSIATDLDGIDNPVAQDAATALRDAVGELQRVEFAAIQATAETLRSDVEELRSALDGPGTSVAEGIDAVETDLEEGLAAIRTGALTLQRDLDELGEGLITLADDGAELAAGAAELLTGLGGLLDGAGDTVADLAGLIERAPNLSDAQRIALASALGTPVNLQEQTLNEMATFGGGFAPFFLSLALFVGAIIVWMIFDPIRSRATASGVGMLRTVWVSYWPGLILGTIQAMVLYLVVMFGVGLSATHPVGLALFAVLVSATFLAVIQALNAVFGEAIGRFVTLAFLMFQLVSSGGIYPVETTARPIQALHGYDPMTYTVNGFRQLTAVQSPDARLGTAIAVLAGILLVSLAISALSVRRDRQYTMTRLYPIVDV